MRTRTFTAEEVDDLTDVLGFVISAGEKGKEALGVPS